MTLDSKFTCECWSTSGGSPSESYEDEERLTVGENSGKCVSEKKRCVRQDGTLGGGMKVIWGGGGLPGSRRRRGRLCFCSCPRLRLVRV